MKFFRKNYNYLLLAALAVSFLMMPAANVSAAEFGCVVSGECMPIDQPDEGSARDYCENYCVVLNNVSWSEDKVCNFTPSCKQLAGSSAGVQSNGCEFIGGKEVCKLTNPIGVGQKGTTEVSAIIGKIISTLLGIIGGLTLLMFVYGGFQWLTSAGNPEKIKSGMQTMVWAVIGVMLVLASYLLLSTFLSFLTGKAT